MADKVTISVVLYPDVDDVDRQLVELFDRLCGTMSRSSAGREMMLTALGIVPASMTQAPAGNTSVAVDTTALVDAINQLSQVIMASRLPSREGETSLPVFESEDPPLTPGEQSFLEAWSE